MAQIGSKPLTSDDVSEGADAADPQDTVSEPNSVLRERGERLKQAVSRAGGLKQVSLASGVPAGTISHYMLGREMKLSASNAIARACGVRLDWLANGDGGGPQMHVYAANEKLFETLNMGRLGECVRTAMEALEGKQPSDPEVGRFVALAYDVFEKISPAELFERAHKASKD